MDEFKKGFPQFYEHTKAGTAARGDCLYYGFAIEGNTVFCREGYKNGDAVLAHLGEVRAELDVAVKLVGEGGLNLAVMGPAAELDKLKAAMGDLGTKFFALDGNAMCLTTPAKIVDDTHVTIVPYFTVPDGKMDEFKKGFTQFYEHTKAGTLAAGDCLYYGFDIEGNTVFCREGYKNVAGVLAHLGEVKAELDVAVKLVGEGGLNLAVMGPATELEKLKEAMGPLGTKFFALDENAICTAAPAELAADTHVTIVPYFTVPDGKMDEFKKGFPQFYEHTKAGTAARGDCLYYGFAIEGNTVFCREGYKNGDAVLAHLGEVRAELDVAVKLVGEGGLNLAVMGPATELEKLKVAMGSLGTKFFASDEGSMAKMA